MVFDVSSLINSSPERGGGPLSTAKWWRGRPTSPFRGGSASRSSLDHLRDGEEAVLRVGRIGEDLVPGIAFGDDIVAKPQLLVDDCGQRLDPVGIDLVKLLDPA